MTALAAMKATLKSFGMRHGSSLARCRLCRLATALVRRERAAVRRGRGRTIGWACVSADNEFWRCWDSVKADAWSGREDESDVLARVVAVPKPRKGAKR